MLRWYVSLLLGGGWPAEKTAPAGVFKFSGFLIAPANDGASFLRGAGSPPRHQDDRSRNYPRITLLKRAAKICQTAASRHPCPVGANFPRFTLLLGGGRRTSEDNIKIKNKHVPRISRTFYLSTETISSPQSPISWHYLFKGTCSGDKLA
jgi:hypothetical protein